MSESKTITLPTYSEVFYKQLDEKRRLCIPAKWRFSGDESENSYLAILTKNKSIIVLPPARAAELTQSMKGIKTRDPRRRAMAKVMENTCTFGCDKQGRIKLNDTLLNGAQITKEVCIAGMFDSFEIWNPKLREEWIGEVSQEEVDDLLDDFGI